MEDLWKVRDLGYRLDDLADKAEYDRLVKRFHEEEITCNARNLLDGPETFPARNADKKGKT
jgi:hypothetical protein